MIDILDRQYISLVLDRMHPLVRVIKRCGNSIKNQKLQYPSKHYMQEVQMALMEQPITEINQFSTQKLAQISHLSTLSREQIIESSLKQLKFDGKLHLDLKIDKILLQIQECKINLAQLLEMYLPSSSNQIEIKQLKLTNLKPSFQQEPSKVQINVANQQLQQEKPEGISVTQQQKKGEGSDKFMGLRKTGSYEINAFEQLKKAEIKQSIQQSASKLSLNPPTQHEQQQQQIPHGQQLKTITQEQINLHQKQIQGKQVGQQLTKQLNEQQVAEQMAQKQLKTSSQDQVMQKIQQQISTFKKTLMLRQAQLGMLIFITEVHHDQHFFNNYQDIYQSLKKYVIPVERLKDPINVFVLEEVFEIESQFLVEYVKYIEEIKKRLEDYRKSEGQELTGYSISAFTKESTLRKLEKVLKSVFKLKIINSKIITMAEIFPYACVKDLNDLFSYSKSHQRWQHLIHNDIITYKIYGQPQKVRKAFESLKNNLNIVNASMNILNQSKDLNVLDYNNWGKIFDSASKILKVALFKSDAHHEAALMMSEPDGKLAKEIWNLPENKTLQNFISAVLPTIEFSQKIYIPRVLNSYLQTKGKQPLPNSFCINHITQYGNQLYSKSPYQKKLPCRINAKHRIHRRYETKTLDQKQQEKKPQSYSRMFFNTLSSMTKAVSSINSLMTKEKENSSTAILHIHGGGFISMSSFIHQTYTRPWANNLGVPILSVDYGKAPEYPYPKGLYDCLQAYLWLRFVFRQVYKSQVEKVIIVGDSAGGNLAAALTTLLIEWNLPKPDGLVLVYPALNLNFNDYTPSLLHALNDMILPHTFLKLCLKAYIKDPSFSPVLDQLISPIRTSSQTLKKYPRTKIFVGGKDPFHDDCCRFVERINQQRQGIADLTIFDEFPHGFLNFDMATNPHDEARKATKEVEKGLREVMEYNEREGNKGRGE